MWSIGKKQLRQKLKMSQLRLVARGVNYRRRYLQPRWRKSMFHLIWYVLIGLIAGLIAKSVMNVHMTIFWTIVLGIIGSILGGGITHMFTRPSNERYHPAGIIVSILGAMLVLYICFKLNIHFPRVNPF
jgi:uncharacterized membrane protein YeaQ/YmgE (transglycosylase-associated protein family)